MMKLVVLFALVATVLGEPSAQFNRLSSTGRIVGGATTSIEEAPYAVSIQVFGVLRCGGSIISENWILTAAHCHTFSPSWYTIRSGSTSFTSGGTVSTDLTFFIHEGYHNINFGVPLNDIALIQLSTPLVFGSTQQPIALFAAGQEAPVGSAAVMVGWGATREHGPKSDVLLTATVPIILTSDCNLVYSNWGGLRGNQICGGFPQGNLNTCEGDTGGPVVVNGALAGISSWSNGCARPGFPTIYTEVAAYRSWITVNSGV